MPGSNQHRNDTGETQFSLAAVSHQKQPWQHWREPGQGGKDQERTLHHNQDPHHSNTKSGGSRGFTGIRYEENREQAQGTINPPTSNQSVFFVCHALDGTAFVLLGFRLGEANAARETKAVGSHCSTNKNIFFSWFNSNFR